MDQLDKKILITLNKNARNTLNSIAKEVKLLLKKNYIVHGIKRRSSLFNTDRIDHLYNDPHSENNYFHLYYCDMTDSTNLARIIQEVQQDEIFNLAAMSHVQVSF